MSRTFEAWRDSRLGKKINLDGKYGTQCTDAAWDYAAYMTGAPWYKSIGMGNANVVFDRTSDKYWIKVANDTSKPDQLPPRGSVLVYGKGPGAAAFGHICIVDNATNNYVDVIQQDGAICRKATAADRPLHNIGDWIGIGTVHRARLNYGRVIGWLIPRNMSSKLPNTSNTPDKAVVSRTAANKKVRVIRSAGLWGLGARTWNGFSKVKDYTEGDILEVTGVVKHSLGSSYYTIKGEDQNNGINVVDTSNYAEPKKATLEQSGVQEPPDQKDEVIISEAVVEAAKLDSTPSADPYDAIFDKETTESINDVAVESGFEELADKKANASTSKSLNSGTKMGLRFASYLTLAQGIVDYLLELIPFIPDMIITEYRTLAISTLATFMAFVVQTLFKKIGFKWII